ncbi:MAG: DegT/DnrJ/EryC1/StrS family aminotransferase [Firmicutes bacterium]|nr:DegT/DnrJ/EryC1/StrS family aminotransferase [Bacillota bacterium]
MSTRIPLLDLNPQVNSIWDEITGSIQDVIRSGQFIMGPNVKAFEEETAAYLGVKHAIGVNSGTDALFIALRALGIGPGDEVITTPFTFFATGEAISAVGADPVFVDVNPATFNLDSDLAEAAITPRTKAILPVHLYGQPADMRGIVALAKGHGLKVVEDVAQGFGGECLMDDGWMKLGAIGDVGCYSFFPTKNLSAMGDAGMIATNDDQAAEIAGMLRVHGSRKKYYNEEIGYNSRLDEIQAAILRKKLPRLDTWNEGRRRVAERYNELLRDIPWVLTPDPVPGTRHVYCVYTVRVLDGKRDQVQKHLAEAGVSTMIYYPVPLHRLPVYSNLGYELSVADRLAGEVLSLPIWPEMSDDLIGAVCESIKAAL